MIVDTVITVWFNCTPILADVNKGFNKFAVILYFSKFVEGIYLEEIPSIK